MGISGGREGLNAPKMEKLWLGTNCQTAPQLGKNNAPEKRGTILYFAAL
jgi:hypothetical protein